jgi:hypothetical protein
MRLFGIGGWLPIDAAPFDEDVLLQVTDGRRAPYNSPGPVLFSKASRGRVPFLLERSAERIDGPRRGVGSGWRPVITLKPPATCQLKDRSLREEQSNVTIVSLSAW